MSQPELALVDPGPPITTSEPEPTPPPEELEDTDPAPAPVEESAGPVILRGTKRSLSLIWLVIQQLGTKESQMPPPVFETWADVIDAFEAAFGDENPHVGERPGKKGDPWKVDELGTDMLEVPLTREQFNFANGMWLQGNLSFYRIGNGHLEQRKRRALAREAIGAMKAAAEG